MQLEGARVAGREVLEVVDDTLEHDRLLVQGGEQFRVGVDDAVSGHFQPAADVGERGAQFMGDVGDHRLALRLHPFAALRQLVERHGQRLGHVVVRAELQAEQNVVLRGAGGEHEDGDVVALPQHPAHAEAVDDREHQVQDDQVRPVAAGLGECGPAVMDHGGGVSLLQQ